MRCVILCKFFFCCLWIQVICPQGSELLAISSYQLCYNIVPNANSTEGGTTDEGKYIGCDSPDSTVTTLDIRLVAGTTSNEVFNVDLTVVPTRGNIRQTTNGKQCQADPNAQEDCSLVTPAQIRITGSKYVYFYKTRRSSLVVPQYCHLGQFDMKPSLLLDLSTVNQQHIQYAGTVKCLQNTHVEYCGARDGSSCNNALHMFGDPTSLSYNLFNDTSIGPFYYKNARQNFAHPVNLAYPYTPGSCRDTFFTYDAIRKGPRPATLFNPSGTTPLFNFIDRDDYATVHSFPISDPPPLGLQSKVNTYYGDVLQNTFCGGYNCGGGYSGICYSQYYNSSTEAGAATAHAGFVGTRYNAGTGDGNDYTGPIGVEIDLFSLGPECALYEIDEIPEVLLTIDIEVNTNFSDPEATTDDNITVNQFGYTSTQSFRLSNLMGYQSVPSQQFVAGARVLSVDTLDGNIGPRSRHKYMVMCANPQVGARVDGKTQDYTDPREIYVRQQEQASRDSGARDDGSKSGSVEEDPESIGIKNYQFIDMVSYVRERDAPYDPTFNPWEVIKEGLPGKSVYYPTGENLNYSPIPDRKKRDATFYMIEEDDASWVGRGCNQIGITDLFWNTNFKGGTPSSTSSLEQCFLKPFTCIPGYTNNSFGGRSITGCMASAAYKAAEVGNPDQFQYNGDQIGEILSKSLPQDYIPETPNYWTTVDAARGSGIVFDPSGTTYPQIPLSIELLIDLVGEFVSEEAVVPNGEIVRITCVNGSVSGQNVGNMTIENRGTISGSYVAQITCPDGEVVFDNSELVFDDVASGGFASAFFYFDASVETDSFTSINLCLAELLPASGVAFALLDAVAFSCSFSDDVIDDVDPPIIPVNPLDPLVPKESDCGCWDFKCYQAFPDGKSSDSPCYYILIILLSVTGGMFVFGCGLLIADYLTKKEQSKLLRKTYKEDYEKIIKQQIAAKSEGKGVEATESAMGK